MSLFAPAAGLLSLVVLAGGCATATVGEVADGNYTALVPSDEQFALDMAGALPGGAVALHEGGVGRIEVDIDAGRVVVRLDGIDAATREITDRIDVTDGEGSGPFKAKRTILVLGDEPLVLGELTINEPVVWPGSFEDSPVITIKSRNSDERGPGVSCRTDELCLILSSGVDPTGSYADANNPELAENPVDTILMNDRSIDLELDTGDVTSIPVTASSFTRACGLSENRIWDLPPNFAPTFSEPVLVHTLCPSTPGGGIQLAIMERSAIPVLAPITDATEGDWCAAGPTCWLFVPT